ncbi:MAG: arsenate reductase family protein [Eubacteriales bacterium]|nr:arsenate reductase family protein [Eubacteriales bacterium]
MLFLCYPKCSTCKKAAAFLDARGIPYDQRDIKAENPTAEELKAWHEKSGLPLKRFFNTSGQLYRAMELSKKLPDMSEEEQYALLASDGMLVKRPIVVGPDFVLVGFRQKEWEQTL